MRLKTKPLICSLSEYEKWLTMREYWDDFADEWNNSTIEEKLIRLVGYVKQGGDLNLVLNSYAENRDLSYRYRIQHCVFAYIERLISGSHFAFGTPIISRIKRLDKEELVKLLTEELIRSVKEIKDYDADFIPISYWDVTDEYLNNDDILDRIEREHWRKNPDENFSYYLGKEKRWCSGLESSLW